MSDPKKPCYCPTQYGSKRVTILCQHQEGALCRDPNNLQFLDALKHSVRGPRPQTEGTADSSAAPSMSDFAKRIAYLRHLVMESAKVTTGDYFTVDELTTILAALEDARRLNRLEEMVSREPLLLHNGESGFRYLGLGLKNTGRTLRQALDQCDAYEQRRTGR